MILERNWWQNKRKAKKRAKQWNLTFWSINIYSHYFHHIWIEHYVNRSNICICIASIPFHSLHCVVLRFILFCLHSIRPLLHSTVSKLIKKSFLPLLQKYANISIWIELRDESPLNAIATQESTCLSCVARMKTNFTTFFSAHFLSRHRPVSSSSSKSYCDGIRDEIFHSKTQKLTPVDSLLWHCRMGFFLSGKLLWTESFVQIKINNTIFVQVEKDIKL